MTIGERIKKARSWASLSQKDLALAISQFGDGKNLSRTAIAQWESGITKEIGAANLLKAAKILQVSPEWLQFGTGSKKTLSQNQGSVLLTDLGLRIVPLLSYVQAANYMEFDDSHVIYTGIDETLAAATGPHTFALTIKGKSMVPDLNPGDIVIIDPSIKPMPGEIVLAKLEKEDTLFLRRYRPLEKDGTESDAFELIPTNEFWPTITVNNKNPGHVIGTLVEHRCRRRLIPPDSLNEDKD